MEWQVTKVDSKHLSVVATGKTISHVDGVVTFTDEHPCGVRCCYESVPTTRLGSTGADIVGTLRRVLTEPRVSMRPTGFELCLAREAEADIALSAIRELEARYAIQPLVVA